jgi:hypothetical protein
MWEQLQRFWLSFRFAAQLAIDACVDTTAYQGFFNITFYNQHHTGETQRILNNDTKFASPSLS